MEIVNGTYRGNEAPNPVLEAIKSSSQAVQNYANVLQEKRVANAQALVAQVEALNTTYGARAFQQPPAMPNNQPRYKMLMDDYNARIHLLGAAGQALKEAGGIKNPTDWIQAYMTGGISKQQENNWQFSLEPDASNQAQPSPATIPYKAAVNGPGYVAKQAQAVVTIPGGAASPAPVSAPAPAPESSLYVDRVNSLGLPDTRITPEDAGTLYSVRDRSTGQNLRGLSTSGFFKTQPEALAALNLANKQRADAPAMASENAKSMTTDQLKLALFGNLNGKTFGQWSPIEQQALQQEGLARGVLQNKAGGTGQPRQLTASELAAYEKRTGDIHHLALVGEKEGIINARAMAAPGVAQAVRTLNTKLPAYAGGKNGMPSSIDQSAINGSIPGNVPSPQQWQQMSPQEQQAYQAALNARGDPERQQLAQQQQDLARWEVANLPSSKWSPSTISLVQAAQQQQPVVATGNEQSALATQRDQSSQQQSMSSQQMQSEAPGVQSQQNANGSLTALYGSGLSKSATPAGVPQQQPATQADYAAGSEPTVGAMRYYGQPGGLPTGYNSDIGAVAPKTPVPGPKPTSPAPVATKSVPYIANAQALLAQSNTAAQAGNTSQAQANLAQSVTQASTALRALQASPDFQDFKQESLTHYRDWINSLSQHELASYGLDDVAQAKEREDNHALEVAKLAAQTKYWQGLLDAQNVKQSPLGVLADYTKDVLGTMPIFRTKDGAFDEQSQAKWLNEYPAYQKAFDIYAYIASGGTEKKGTVDWIQNDPTWLQKLGASFRGQTAQGQYVPLINGGPAPGSSSAPASISPAAQALINKLGSR